MHEKDLGIKHVFETIFRNKRWGNIESVSGPGSRLEQTRILREVLPDFFRDLGVKSILDLPCGDFYWLSKVELGVEKYVGADIVEELIESNQEKYTDDAREFRVLNIISDDLPETDLIFTRDCLVHFSNEDIRLAVDNLKKSRAKYLLTTTFPDRSNNTDIETGMWRPINLTAEPFLFPEPLALINEGCTEGNGIFSDKSLGLWRISQLP